MPSILTRPLTFATPSVVNDSPQARAKVKRDLLREILRAAERYLGPQQIDQVVRDHRRARGGRRPNEPLNNLLLAQHDVAAADGPVDIPKFSEECYKAYRSQSAKAVEKRLRRLLKAREKARAMDRKLKAALQRPSLVGESLRDRISTL
jgi:hypothetical protein